MYRLSHVWHRYPSHSRTVMNDPHRNGVERSYNWSTENLPLLKLIIFHYLSNDEAGHGEIDRWNCSRLIHLASTTCRVHTHTRYTVFNIKRSISLPTPWRKAVFTFSTINHVNQYMLGEQTGRGTLTRSHKCTCFIAHWNTGFSSCMGLSLFF